MAPRPRWWHQLQASKHEARLAVDIYNRVSGERQLEAYIVHMNLAWLKAMQARRERDGEDLFIRDERGWRQRGKYGEFLTLSLGSMLKDEFTGHDPVPCGSTWSSSSGCATALSTDTTATPRCSSPARLRR